MYSVVPGGTVVSMRTRHEGWIFPAMILIDSSRAAISALPEVQLPSSALRKSHCTSTTTTSARLSAS